ncbi:MAG: DUF3267 domain-containing protein [Lysinibacillus sp.]
MQPTIIQLDLPKVIKQNIIWTVVASILFISLNFALQPQKLNLSFGSIILSVILFGCYYVLLIVLHEAFHLLGFVVFGRVPIRSLSYGIDLERGIAYATTTERMPNAAMKKALLLPFWTTGVMPTLIGFCLNDYTIILVGAFLIAGAVGDFAMYKELRKFPDDAQVQDDPKEPKLYVYET